MTHDHDHSHTHSHTHSHSHDHSDGHDHKHDQDHAHSHGHSHAHGHSHSHADQGGSGEMSMEDKLLTLFSHWIDHNDSHKDNFVSWADKAKDAGFDQVAEALKEAGSLSQDVTDKLKAALAALKA